MKNRKVISVGIALVAVIAVSGIAYAYWSAGGSGSGSANAAAGVTDLTVNGPTLNPMFPGDTAQSISGTFNNPNAAATWVNTVTVSITVTKALGAPAGTCDTSDFTLANPAATVNALIPVGNPVGNWSGPTIMFNNKASNQDACKGATVNLTYTIS